MGLNKFIIVFGIAALAWQPINSASIGASDGACICTTIYDPACGNDFRTYSSECDFNCAQRLNRDLETFTKGECAEVQNLPLERIEKIQEVGECFCTFEYNPVCASNGKTYNSECEFNCDKRLNRDLEIISNGHCVVVNSMPLGRVEKIQETHECFCTLDYSPVCGSDGKTYASECEFNCAKRLNRDLEIQTQGQCVEVNTLPMEQIEKLEEVHDCFCTFEYSPVCASNGKTYDSECEFNCDKKLNRDLEIISRGHCVVVNSMPLARVEKIQETHECFCTLDYSPVCGSDGKTYASECEFNCAKRLNRDLEIQTQGQCVEVNTLPMEQIEKLDEVHDCFCTFEYNPVCASNGKTYDSECEFNCDKKLNRDLEIISSGHCVVVNSMPLARVEKIQEPTQCFCTLDYNPVCGSDGKTYASECEFNCAKRFNRDLVTFTKGECIKIENLPLEQVEKMQEVHDCFCTFEYNPVCASNGKTYDSECEFNCDKKLKRDLEIISRGHCVLV